MRKYDTFRIAGCARSVNDCCNILGFNRFFDLFNSRKVVAVRKNMFPMTYLAAVCIGLTLGICFIKGENSLQTWDIFLCSLNFFEQVPMSNYTIFYIGIVKNINIVRWTNRWIYRYIYCANLHHA